MEFKGTPAPWVTLPEECDRSYIRVRGTVLGGRYKVANVLTPNHEGVDPREAKETRANANLIAAAPELLEALQSIQQSMAKYIEVANNIGVEVLEDGFYLGHAIDVEEKARQAIAKAIGQQ